jgi:YbbR domain-containing protein
MKRLRTIVWQRVLVAFLVAFGLWIYVDITNNPSTKTTIKLQVQKIGLPQGYVLIDESGQENTTLPMVEVVVYASQATINALRADENIKATIDVSKVGIGEQLVSINVVPDTGLGYIKAEAKPSQMAIRIDTLKDLEFPVDRALGNDSYDIALYKPDIFLMEPNSGMVRITGPAGLVNSVSTAQYTIDIASRTADYTVDADVVLKDKFNKTIKGVTVIPPQITARVVMNPSSVRKQVVIEPTLRGSVAPGYRINGITVDPVFVTINGKAGALDGVSSIATDVIDIGDATATITMTVLLTNNLGDSITLAENTPRAVDVVIAIGKTTDPLRVKLPYAVTILDAPAGMVFNAEPAVVYLDMSLGVNAQRTGLSGIAPEVRVGEWDSANPMRQVQLNLPSDVRLLNDLPFIRLERVGEAPVMPTQGAGSDATATPVPADGAATPTAPVDGTTDVVGTTTPGATATATATATASATVTSTPVPTATP